MYVSMMRRLILLFTLLLTNRYSASRCLLHPTAYRKNPVPISLFTILRTFYITLCCNKFLSSSSVLYVHMYVDHTIIMYYETITPTMSNKSGTQETKKKYFSC